MSKELRNLENLWVQGLWAERVDDFRYLVAKRSNGDKFFKVECSVLVVHGTVFTTANEVRAQIELYEPCTVEEAKHPRYMLESGNGPHSLDWICTWLWIRHNPCQHLWTLLLVALFLKWGSVVEIQFRTVAVEKKSF